MIYSLPFLIALLFALPVEAADCTKGLDCYCDCVDNPASTGSDVGGYANTECQTKGVPFDTGVLFCEDFEAPTLHSEGTCTGDATVQCLVDGDCSGIGTCDETVWRGDGAPNFGPWYDHSGSSTWWGYNQYWRKYYISYVNVCSMQIDSPASPREGAVTCETVGQACNAGEWSEGDPWQSNSFACMDIVGAGEFDDEIIDGGSQRIVSPSTVHDGKYVFAYRNEAGADKTAGIIGYSYFYNYGQSRPVSFAQRQTATEVGLTMAIAYSDNAGDSNLLASAWKHEELLDENGGVGPFWYMGNTGNSAPSSQWPFASGLSQPYMHFCTGAGTPWYDCLCDYDVKQYTDCTDVDTPYSGCLCDYDSGNPSCDEISEVCPTCTGSPYYPDGSCDEHSEACPRCGPATTLCDEGTSAPFDMVVGSYDCKDTGIRYSSGSSVYNQATDWPWGEWGCVQAHIWGIDTTSLNLDIWLTTPGDARKLVTSFRDFNSSNDRLRLDAMSGFVYNNYANANQPGAGSGPSTETVKRFIDNQHWREGAPVSCAQIGFAAYESTGVLAHQPLNFRHLTLDK